MDNKDDSSLPSLNLNLDIDFNPTNNLTFIKADSKKNAKEKNNTEEINKTQSEPTSEKKEDKAETETPQKEEKEIDSQKQEKPMTGTEKLRQAIFESLEATNFKSSITFEENEQNDGGQVIITLALKGRVPKSREADYTKLKSLISQKLTPILGEAFMIANFDRIFNVECGLCEKDEFPDLEVSDLEGNKVRLLDKDKPVTYINFWSLSFPQSQEQIREEIDIFSGFDTDKLLTEKNIKIKSISNEVGPSRLKIYCQMSGFDCIPQYCKSDIFDVIGIRTLPFSIIIDKNGKIAYVGNPSKINIKESIFNISEGKEIVMNKEEKKDEESNAWFGELDHQTKSDIVLNTNMSLKEVGTRSAGFAMSTRRRHLDGKTTITHIPEFFGLVSSEEFEAVQTLALNLESDFNMQNFRFNLRILGGY